MVALLTCEGEYIVASSTACQSLWVYHLINDLVYFKGNPIKMLVDNKFALDLTKNHVHHSRSKHIDIRHHFIRDCVEEGLIKLEYVKTEAQLADFFTKPLGKIQFCEFGAKIGVTIIGDETY